MSHNEEVASLTLLTSDLTVSSTSYIGTCDQYRTNMTWSNLNLRTILGPMYDKYDRFCLQCVYIFFTSGDGVFGTEGRDRHVSLNICGLPFTNATYDSALKINYTHGHINSVILPQGGSVPVNRESPRLMFNKNQELADIDIFYKYKIFNQRC